MRSLLHFILRRFIVTGRLTVDWPDGSSTVYQGQPGSQARVRLRDTRTVRRIATDPGMAIGEAYTDGTLAPVGCDIHAVLDLLLGNIMAETSSQWILHLRAALGAIDRRLARYNPAPEARRNVAHHYDLSERLYSLFLDRDRQYSCGYFERGDETLEEAQSAKKRHVAAKLLLDRPGLRVLDIGSGWGGMALTLARDYGARVTGITLSTEQLAASRARAAIEGLTDRVSFELLDYRTVHESFDRIVSVGMFEHVGVGDYPAFFALLRRCLAADGVALLHSIGRGDGPGHTNPWVAKYIFPGGYCPALSEVLPAVERCGLLVNDIEILRLHYAETLHHWRRRFAANRNAVQAIYDERFCRMWEFYLAASELSFRRKNYMVFQMQLTRGRDVVPQTRDYLYRATAAEPAGSHMPSALR